MKKDALVIFTKNAVAGKVKTRLAATVGDDVALSVYHKLVKHTSEISKGLPLLKYVFYSDTVVQNDLWFKKYFCKELQHGKDLGERMSNAIALTFNKGVTKVVIVGTDCPGLTSQTIMNAFSYLNNHKVVIGPAADGGYYLLGLIQHNHELFTGISWSSHKVLEETISKCVTLQLNYRLLDVLNDVDDEKDLVHLNL